MESFAEYILNEKDIGLKMEITYYLAKKRRIFFDKSVLFKTEITSQDSLVYLLKVFGGEDLDSISKEINQSYSNPR